MAATDQLQTRDHAIAMEQIVEMAIDAVANLWVRDHLGECAAPAGAEQRDRSDALVVALPN